MVSDSEDDLLPGSDWSFDRTTSEDEPPTASFRGGSGFSRSTLVSEDPDVQADVQPPRAAAMHDDAPSEIMAGELKRFLDGSMAELSLFKAAFPKEEDIDEEFGTGETSGLEVPKSAIRRENST